MKKYTIITVSLISILAIVIYLASIKSPNSSSRNVSLPDLKEKKIAVPTPKVTKTVTKELKEEEKESRVESTKIERNELSKSALNFIEKHTSPTPTFFNNKKYKMVSGVIAKAHVNKDQERPFFKLYGYSFYKADTTENQQSDEMRVVINTNTDTIGILTGKIVLDFYGTGDAEKIANKYDLVMDYNNPAIKTAIVRSNGPIHLLITKLSNEASVANLRTEIIESAPISK